LTVTIFVKFGSVFKFASEALQSAVTSNNF